MNTCRKPHIKGFSTLAQNQREFRYNNKAFLLLVWSLAGPLNPNWLLFYYGFSTSQFLENINQTKIIGFLIIPTVIMATIMLKITLRRGSLDLEILFISAALSLACVLVLSPFFVIFTEAVLYDQGPLTIGEVINGFLAISLFGWLFMAIPIMGINLAKFAVIYAVIIFYLATKKKTPRPDPIPTAL